tara:strand:- start:26437 stop:26772 length:336 start_codon:yes stop_codon:yes gene_type:complete
MATLEQIQMKVKNYKIQRQKIQDELDDLQSEMDELREEKEKIQEQIDGLVGVQEESADGAITTTTAGNISKLGGSGNYAPKIGGMQKRKKKKGYEYRVGNFIDKLFDKKKE